MELSLLILVCIHKSYIVYLEIYFVMIDHGFSFFGHGKSMLKKRGHPVYRNEARCNTNSVSLWDGEWLTP